MQKFTIFTDGSSLGNPGPGGFGAIICDSEKNKINELGGMEKHTTNNRMEIRAVVEALLYLGNKKGDVLIYIDSAYVLNGITSWIYGWEKNNWITKDKNEVLNKDLWQELSLVNKKRLKLGKIKWEKIKGHSGVDGNERADVIATSFAMMKPVELYEGKLKDYEEKFEIYFHDIVSKKKPPTKNKKNIGPAYSYLSLIKGKIYKWKTWAECEKKVKGVSGVKYKKAKSAEEEKEILKEWGF
ncbi:MAG: viroplasmin family protein [Candidatus Paceibacterota bacterium]